VEKSTHAWLCRFSVVNQLGLDALKGGDGYQRFCYTGTQSSEDCTRTADVAFFIGERTFKRIKRQESIFYGIPYNCSRTTCIPLLAEFWPRELLAGGQAPVEL